MRAAVAYDRPLDDGFRIPDGPDPNAHPKVVYMDVLHLRFLRRFGVWW